MWANLWANLATRYLRAVASRNRFADRYAIELAEAVLESRLFRLALDVIDCEEHIYSRATDLAGAVLEVVGAGSEAAAPEPTVLQVASDTLNAPAVEGVREGRS